MNVHETFCRRYDQLYGHVEQIPIEVKRKLTQLNNLSQYNEHSFLLQHGCTLGEYNLMYFLIYSNKRKEYQHKSSMKRTEQSIE